MVRFFDTQPTPQAIEAGGEALAANEYPGRVIVMGLNSVGRKAIQAYALMGRSEGSRNRVFVRDDENTIYTTAPNMTDEEMAKVENAELIYYKAMQRSLGAHVVSNGAQTESVAIDLAKYKMDSLHKAVEAAPVVGGVELSKYEPDGPNYTPRITGVVNLGQGVANPFAFEVVRKDPDSDEAVRASFLPEGTLQAGVGYTVHTYAGNGSPLPSFDTEPYPIQIGEDAADTAEMLWDRLDKQNRVAIVVKSIALAPSTFGGAEPQYHIINGRDHE